MTGREIRDFLLPWTGLAVGVVTVATVHQFGAYGTFDHCRPISPVPLLVVAVIGIVIIVLAGLASSRVLREDSETQARRVIAAISVGCSALFVFAILLPMVASLVLPPCFQ